jgi:CTP-dependent riboflavin kinase
MCVAVFPTKTRAALIISIIAQTELREDAALSCGAATTVA